MKCKMLYHFKEGICGVFPGCLDNSLPALAANRRLTGGGASESVLLYCMRLLPTLHKERYYCDKSFY